MKPIVHVLETKFSSLVAALLISIAVDQARAQTLTPAEEEAKDKYDATANSAQKLPGRQG